MIDFTMYQGNVRNLAVTKIRFFVGEFKLLYINMQQPYLMQI